ncbi:MAG: hypothetical protein ACN6QY_00525 [Pseudomonas sp.]|uniref:hypothetical protein n=1 Tax=Pseudomonas sp. TaxID=306 RepID=UPI003D0D3D00
MRGSQGVVVGLALLLGGCLNLPAKPQERRTEQRMLCSEGSQRVTLPQRFSFDLPEPFRHAECSAQMGGFSYDRISDSLSVATSGTFAYGDVQVSASSLYMKVSSFLDGEGYGLMYPRDAFLQAKLAALALPGSGARPREVEWVTRGGYQCLRFHEHWQGAAVGLQEDEVRYWCWEGESGLGQPFYVHAGQRLALGAKGYDLDQTFILPFFASLQIKRLAPSTLAQAQSRLQAVCARGKARYDRGSAWGSDYPDKRLTLTRLHYCGYDVPLPDLQVPAPDSTRK